MPIHDWNRVDAGVFHDFHTTWIPDIKRALIGGLLPPGYYAMVQLPTSDSIPDVLTLQGASDAEVYAGRARQLVVRHSSDDRIAAIVEIVSPGNKHSRIALRTFVDKAAYCLRAGINLLIVDLLPPGPRDPQGIHAAIWSEIDGGSFTLPPGQPLTFVSYIGGEAKEAFIQPAAVGELLPEVPLFLEPDRYINVPLEPSYQSAFAAVPDHWREMLESPRLGGK